MVGVFQDGSQLGYRNRKILAILNFHNTPMPSIKFQLNFTYCLKDAGSKNFSHGSHLGYQNRKILAILKLYVTPMPPPSFTSIPLTVHEQMWFEDFRRCRLKNFSHGSHLGYQNRTILAILKLHVTSMPPLTFSSIPLIILEETSKL